VIIVTKTSHYNRRADFANRRAPALDAAARPRLRKLHFFSVIFPGAGTPAIGRGQSRAFLASGSTSSRWAG
jgi:hypothetical protein